MMSQDGENGAHDEAARKHLETQHWLELIDGWVSSDWFDASLTTCVQEASLWLEL